MKLFAQNYNNILNHVLPHYEITTNLLEADKVVVWNDLVSPQKQIVEMAKEYGKESIVVEHGMKAVSDYQIDLKDITNRMGAKPFIADKICVWGNKSKEIMLEAGVSAKKIFVVGSPIVWEYSYKYTNGNMIIEMPYYQGEITRDPETQEDWKFLAYTKELPQVDKGSMICYFPGHDYHSLAIERINVVYDQIKDNPNLFVVASSNFINEEERNPFAHLFKIPHEERKFKIAFPDMRRQNSLQMVKFLIRKSKLVITTQPGTPNGLCWAYDTPVLTPKIDIGWRKNGKKVFDIHPADYSCKPTEVGKKMKEIFIKDTKVKQRAKFAREFMGIEAGNPAENIRKAIEAEV